MNVQNVYTYRFCENVYALIRVTKNFTNFSSEWSISNCLEDSLHPNIFTNTGNIWAFKLFLQHAKKIEISFDKWSKKLWIVWCDCLSSFKYWLGVFERNCIVGATGKVIFIHDPKSVIMKRCLDEGCSEMIGWKNKILKEEIWLLLKMVNIS